MFISEPTDQVAWRPDGSRLESARSTGTMSSSDRFDCRCPRAPAITQIAGPDYPFLTEREALEALNNPASESLHSAPWAR